MSSSSSSSYHPSVHPTPYPDGSDGTDINWCAANSDETLVVTGDDFAQIKLFRYPAPDGAKCKTSLGHAEHVTSVAFAADGTRFYSAGGRDNAVIQWKLE